MQQLNLNYLSYQQYCLEYFKRYILLKLIAKEINRQILSDYFYILYQYQAFFKEDINQDISYAENEIPPNALLERTDSQTGGGSVAGNVNPTKDEINAELAVLAKKHNVPIAALNVSASGACSYPLTARACMRYL